MEMFMLIVFAVLFLYMIGNTVKKVNDNPAAKAAGLSLLERLLKR